MEMSKKLPLVVIYCLTVALACTIAQKTFDRSAIKIQIKQALKKEME